VLANPYMFLGGGLFFGSVLLGGTYLALRSSISSAVNSPTMPVLGPTITTVGEILDQPGPISINFSNNRIVQPTFLELIAGGVSVYAIYKYLASKAVKYIPKVISRRV
jgi:hypothetical protein